MAASLGEGYGDDAEAGGGGTLMSKLGVMMRSEEMRDISSGVSSGVSSLLASTRLATNMVGGTTNLSTNLGGARSMLASAQRGAGAALSPPHTQAPQHHTPSSPSNGCRHHTPSLRGGARVWCVPATPCPSTLPYPQHPPAAGGIFSSVMGATPPPPPQHSGDRQRPTVRRACAIELRAGARLRVTAVGSASIFWPCQTEARVGRERLYGRQDARERASSPAVGATTGL
eukprot:scaffold46200_cov66-Phaeocystis_antarctica.AAC.1